MPSSIDQPSSDIQSHYEQGYEAGRLFRGVGVLERVRTQEILQRLLPPPPATILDVGGGAGVYALWLAKQGYSVHLVDLMPLHIQQAIEASYLQPEHPLASATVGDARKLAFDDASFDAVLLLGPLYHLTDRTERIGALKEAYRVLRPGGWVMAAGISRFASTLDGLHRGFMKDPEFAQIAAQDRRNGQHRNPGNHPNYFTTAFFHHPEELRTEIELSGFQVGHLLGIEGPGWLVPNFKEQWEDSERRALLLQAIWELEAEPTLLGMSAHLMATGRKPLVAA